MAQEASRRYKESELNEFKVIIDEKLEKARQEWNYLRQQIIDLNENLGDDQGIDYIDDSSSYSELENLNYMVNRQEQFIAKLENALLRIKNKSYGVCTVTGELIDKERLKRVPHATKSLQAKMGQVEIKDTEIKEPAKKKKSGTPKIKSRIIRKNKAKPKDETPFDDLDDWSEDMQYDEDLDSGSEYMDIDPADLEDEDYSIDDKD